MTENQLSELALDHLRQLAKTPGSLPDLPGLEILWQRRFVMGSKARTHITQSGKAFILKLIEANSADEVQPAP